MFNIVEKNQKLVKGIMITIAATFVLWGIGGYLGNAGDDGYVAKVGSQKIYTRDIDGAIQQNPQNTDKMQVLFGLINRQLLINNINNYHMIATKDQLQQQIANIPSFQNSKGEFSLKQYQDFLRTQFMSAEQFQNNVGQQILINEYLNLFKDSYFSSNLFNTQFAKLLSRERKVSSYKVSVSEFYDKANPNEQQISDYYQQNIAKFTLPEKVKLQYLVLDVASIAGQVQVSDKDLDNYISTHKANISGEQIDASHILIAVPANSDAKTKSAAREKALKILANAKNNPKDFANLARQYSDDHGSSTNGGNLGYFGKGVMAKPFEDAAFNLKPGQISNLVETEYGFHIIKLNSIKGNSSNEIRALALSQLQKQQASVLLQKDLDKLNDITYNQATSLEPAAKALGLTIQSTKDWVTKGSVSGDFANPKSQSAIFNQDVINKHNNSEVVDLGNGSYAVYHVTEYQAAKVQTIAEVKDKIVEQLKSQAASTLASNEGQQKILALQQGKLSLNFTHPENITLLTQSETISPNAIKQIFGTNITKLPAYTGSIDTQGNFIIYKISGEDIDSKLEAQNQKIVEQLGSSDANLVFGAYLGSLRSKYDVSYKTDRLNLQSN
jgi:peptidyl-prolyl cis-trans isomerase D